MLTTHTFSEPARYSSSAVAMRSQAGQGTALGGDLEKPAWIGRLAFFQIGSPIRHAPRGTRQPVMKRAESGIGPTRCLQARRWST